jgi:hypothetical protein
MLGTPPTSIMAGEGVPVTPAPFLSSPEVVTAVEHIRRMRGGSQAHLMRCSDGHFYVVKFKNNPQSPRVLVNEYIAGRLARLLKLPCPNFCLVEVSEDLIHLTPDLSVEEPRSRMPVAAGLAFGSQHPTWRSGKRRILLPILDLRVALSVGPVENLSELSGILVFDKWTANNDGRQISCLELPTERSKAFRMFMYDNGFCFGAGDWRFKQWPYQGLYDDRSVYGKLNINQTVDLWLERLEANITVEELHRIAEELPESWINEDRDELLKMLNCLYERKSIVPSLIRLTLDWLRERNYPGFARAATAGD